MGAKDHDPAKKARAARREAERQVRLATGRPASAVKPAVFRQIQRRAREN